MNEPEKTAVEEVRDIFSILHDGTISSWNGDATSLTLTVECQYLAELIDPSFDRFYVELDVVKELFLSTWPNPADLPEQKLEQLKDVFAAELEILSAEIEDGRTVVVCNQHDTKFDYCGGSLVIDCATVKVYDQSKTALTVERLNEICKSYWDRWSDEWGVSKSSDKA